MVSRRVRVALYLHSPVWLLGEVKEPVSVAVSRANLCCRAGKPLLSSRCQTARLRPQIAGALRAQCASNVHTEVCDLYIYIVTIGGLSSML